MTLSQREQHELDAIERVLAAGNPRLDRRLRRGARHVPPYRPAVRLLCILVGVAIYGCGVQVGAQVGTLLVIGGYCLVAAAIATGFPRL